MAENGTTNTNENTAERELLKTIEADPRAVKPLPKKSTVNISAIQSSCAFFIDTFKNRLSGKTIAIKPAVINQGLLGFIILLAILSTFSIVQGFGRLQNIPTFELSDITRQIAMASEVMLPLKEFPYYSDILIGRNIFVEEQQKQEQALQKAVTSRINELVTNLKVVGLSWSEQPNDRFVMLEDTKASLTHFLKEGDKILNLVVKRIKQESVILGYSEEEIELR